MRKFIFLAGITVIMIFLYTINRRSESSDDNVANKRWQSGNRVPRFSGGEMIGEDDFRATIRRNPTKLGEREYRDKYRLRLANDLVSPDRCQEINSEISKLKLLEHKCYHFLQRSSGDTIGKSAQLVDEVTLVTQLSCSRLNMLLAILKHWNGPISVAVYGGEDEFRVFMQKVKETLYDTNSRHSQQHVRICNVHHVSGSNNKSDMSLYPINYLRNIAVDNVLTDYVFLSDVDFVPSLGLHDLLVQETQRLLKYSKVKRRALVVAAFEEQTRMPMFPLRKYELKYLYENEIVTAFHVKQFIPGHRPTNYSKWFLSSEPYLINWKLNYEPYVVVRKDVPRYNESFIGYSFNKLVHIAELQAAGYQFIVLPNEFLIHRIHPESSSKMQTYGDLYVKKCMKSMMSEVLWRVLPMKYGYGWENQEYIKISSA